MGRYIRAALAARRCRTGFEVMRAEIESIVEDIKRSVGLLRRHL
jgi:hypothetical protein